jgi:hypothetical protein
MVLGHARALISSAIKSTALIFLERPNEPVEKLNFKTAYSRIAIRRPGRVPDWSRNPAID